MKTFVGLSLVQSLSWLAFGKELHKELNTETTSVPNSCIGLEDGEHYIKLLEGDSYPVIKVTCSNGYALIDYSSDSDWQYYFSSFEKWHYEIGGASQMDHLNWDEWYLPSSGNKNTKFIISEDCDVCDESIQSSLRNSQGTNSAYYMNANYYGCFTFPRGMPTCDANLFTLECTSCYVDNFHTNYATDWDSPQTTNMGGCMTWIYGATDEVDRDYDDCTSNTDTSYKPTIGLEGRFCVCTKPSFATFYDVPQSAITHKEDSLKLQKETIKEKETIKLQLENEDANTRIIEVYSKDFEKGTYRIQEPGTYKLMEDVEFDFNAGTSDRPNSEEAWWPNENDEDYPGFGTSRDAFFMGFFAGITIECDDVTIDLNGHELKQSKEFFYQQGFFATIEVQNQPFIPGQGVGFFGSDPFFPENVVIKNGILGRTSHHCIHGNYNKNLIIEDVKCYDFSTHGIQLNGFEGVTMKNVEVGPSNTEQYLSSEYTHYRFILPRLRKIAESNPTGTIRFNGRKEDLTMSDIADELEKQMTYAFKYVMYGEELSEDDEDYYSYTEGLKIFYNEYGYGYGASQYGIFLSYPGANVLSYHLNPETSSDITLENVYIHDLHHQTKEYTGIRTDRRLFVNSFNAPLHIRWLLGEEQYQSILDDGYDATWSAKYHYVGNIITDATLAMSELNQDEWGWNQIMYVLSYELTSWGKGELDGAFTGTGAHFLCAMDGMIHGAKGTFGIRIDGVDDVTMKNVKIESIEEYSPMAVPTCQYDASFSSRTPYHLYYAGNFAQGIAVDYADNLKLIDVEVTNIKSATGRANGIALWPGVNAEFHGEIKVTNLDAGYDFNEDDDFEDYELEMVDPEVCSVLVYQEDLQYKGIKDDDTDASTVIMHEGSKIVSACINGRSGCWGNDVYSMIGQALDCDGNNDNDMIVNDKYGDTSSSSKLKSKNMEQNVVVKNEKFTSIAFIKRYPISIAAFVIGIIAVFGVMKYMKSSSKSFANSPTEYTALVNRL